MRNRNNKKESETPGARPRAHGSYRDVDGILQIVKDGLCHRCGACIGVCPVGTFALDAEGNPAQVAGCVQCDKCVRVCSGASVDYRAIGSRMFGEPYHYGPALGKVRAAYVGHALDEEVRWRGASGGVVSQLLIHLLETGRIKGALVVTPDPDDPARGRGTIARTRDEILTGAQSRYTTAPNLCALKEIAGDQGPFAVVGLPCQIHALRKAQAGDSKLEAKIALVIGLYCHFTLPSRASRELASLVGGDRKPVREVRYRQKDEKGWPHDTVEIHFSNGSKWRSPLGPAETVTILARLYPLGRCLTCLDVTSEFADLAMGDPWIRNETGHWKYSSPGGWTSIITRTEAGEAALLSASDHGRLRLQPIPPREIELGQHAIMDEKKNRIPFRMRIMRLCGRPVPHYPVEVPRATFRIVLQELGFLALRVLPVWGPLRRSLVRLHFSSLGQGFMRWRTKKKREKAVAMSKAASRT